MVVVTLDEVLPLALLARLAFIASRNQTALGDSVEPRVRDRPSAVLLVLPPAGNPQQVGSTTLVS